MGRGFSAVSACALLALLALLAGCGSATAGEVAGLPSRAEAEIFKDAPAPWRDYLLKARSAEQIDDPLQRCLTFPDIPGNQWPSGHAEAHCRNRPIEALSREEFALYVARGDIAELEAHLDKLLQRHFAASDYGEDIHYAFNALTDASPETDALSAAWLEKAPRSGYAHLARASFYAGSAWRARGKKFAAETPPENMRKMSEFADKAIPLFDEAIRLNPRLMPAYVGLLDMGMVDSRGDVERRAFEGAEQVDPACFEMARKRMVAMEPRWGGSYERMLAYGNELAAHFQQRPRLASLQGIAFANRGGALMEGKEYVGESMELLDLAVRKGVIEDALADAGVMAYRSKDRHRDGWKGLAYLLQESRFRPSNPWAARQIAWHMGQLDEPEWAVRYALRAVQADPSSGYGHFILGASYSRLNLYEQSERERLIAAESGEWRKDSLKELAAMWLYADELPAQERVSKARPHIDRLLDEHPDYGAALLLRIEQQRIIGGFVEQSMLENFLKHADRSDPWQARKALEFEEAISRNK
jgi:tetratricopeptide (TPR) repeat protein